MPEYKDLSEAELIALSVVVHREILGMDWVNKQREVVGSSMAYVDDNMETEASLRLIRELQRRKVLD